MRNETVFSKLIFSLLLILVLAFMAACTATPASDGSESDVDQEGVEHNEDAGHDEGGSHVEERIPNDGAVIRIVSPADGATFAQGDEVVVEVETDNFVLGEEGNHWEVYVNDTSWGSVEGGNTDEVLRGLEPGEHEISVFLSLGSHEQLQEGDRITITVEE